MPLAWYYYYFSTYYLSTCGDSGHLRDITVSYPLAETQATCVVLLLLFHLVLVHLAETHATCVVLLLLVHLRDSGHLRGIIDTCLLAETQATCMVLLLLFHLLLVHLRRLRPLAWYYYHFSTFYLSTCGDSGHLRGITVTCPLAETQATCAVLLLLVACPLAETQVSRHSLDPRS